MLSWKPLRVPILKSTSMNNFFALNSLFSEHNFGSEPSAVALGFFDGVHRGHAALLYKTKELAYSLGLRPVVFTFREHPSWILTPDKGVKLLCSLDERLNIIKNMGLEPVAVPFNSEFASIDPTDFVSCVLVERLKAAQVVVGYNYRFGCRAAGDVQMLQKLGSEFGFTTEIIAPFCLDNEIISSSLLRRLVEDGQLQRACHLWGRRYRVGGEIIHGRKVGRTLNIPTANIEVDSMLVKPPRGVFAAVCYLTRPGNAESGAFFRLPGLAYWGNRPTFDHGRDVLEVFLLTEPEQFGPDELYGWHLEVELIEMVRGQVHFPSAEAFVAQVAKDKLKVQTIVAGLPQ